jgi:hypothetical protein
VSREPQNITFLTGDPLPPLQIEIQNLQRKRGMSPFPPNLSSSQFRVVTLEQEGAEIEHPLNKGWCAFET